MKNKTPFIGVAVGVLMWISLMGCLIVEVLQAWYMEGGMAAIDALQWAVVLGGLAFAASTLVGGALFVALYEFTNRD